MSSPSSAGADRVNLAYLMPVCLVATLGGLLFGYDTGVISGAIEPLTTCFGLDRIMKGWASACVLLGCAAGVLAVGTISDRFGRKRALLLAALLFLISAIGTSVPQHVWQFIIFRVLGGVGIGIASMSTPMYIAEITPARLRGRMVAANQIAIVGGMVAVAMVNYVIARHGDATWNLSTGWRWMFAAGTAPAAVFLLLLAMIPESPRWLVEARRETEAAMILARVGGRAFAEAEIAALHASLAAETGSWRELLSPRLRRPLAIGIALAVLQQVTGINVFLYFGVTIFKNLSASTGVDAGLLTQIVINGACMLFTIIAIGTVDLWGRRPLMLVGAAGMGVALLAMGLLAVLLPDPQATGNAMLGCILLYIACFGLSVGPVTWVILAEIFPTAVRGRALGLATFCLWMADFAVTQSFPIIDDDNSWLVAQFHHAFPFFVYAAFCAVLVAVMALWVPETKGRSLEEIARSW